jgi:hypothetical protein
MSSQKSKNNLAGSKHVTTRSRNNKSVVTKLSSHSDKESKPEIKFKKVKKISKSIKRIESEMSHIKTQMQKIEDDLTTIIKFMEIGKKT